MPFAPRLLLISTLLLAAGAVACTSKKSGSTVSTLPPRQATAAASTAPGAGADGGATAAAGAAGTAAPGSGSSGASAAPSVAGSGAGRPPVGTAQAAPATGSVVAVVKALTPSVVRVRTQGSSTVGPFGQVQQARGVGTGIIVDTDGHIVTNNHVVTLDTTQAANSFDVDLWDGRTLTAKLVARDPSSDLAVLQVSAQNLSPAVFADPAGLDVGLDVVAIGYALDLGATPSVTRGIISALHREFTETIQGAGGRSSTVTIGDVIQTDAAINEGNSGGPLVNLNGEIVGINTGAIRPSLTNASAQVQGINYAISVATITPVVKALIEKGNVDRGYLGVNLATIDRTRAAALKLPFSDGVSLQQVVPGGPADRAGLQADDVIVKAGNTDIHTVGDLQQVLIENGPGVKLHIDFYRGSNKQAADVTLSARPAGT